MAADRIFLGWLNDARAFELGLAQSLDATANLARALPEVQAHFRVHADESRNHAELIEGCIRRRGGSISPLKGLLATAGAGLQGAAAIMVGTELLKGVLAAFAAEQLEVAMYESLIIASLELEDPETSEICETILNDEHAMIEWLTAQLPAITSASLNKPKRA